MEELMDKVKNSVILVLFIAVVILLLLRGCGTPKSPEVVLKVKSDTIRTIKIDTVYQVKEKTVFIDRFIPIKSTKALDTNGLYRCNTLNTYKDSLVDSNIVITDISIIRGEPKAKWLSYKLLKGTITKSITNTITKTKTETIYRPYCYSVFGGLRIGGNQNTLSTISPYLALRTKKTYIDVGYNLVDKTYIIGVGMNIFNIK